MIVLVISTTKKYFVVGWEITPLQLIKSENFQESTEVKN